MSRTRKPVRDDDWNTREDSEAVTLPEAYDYSAPLDPEKIRQLQKLAAEELATEKWTLIDGYDWDDVDPLESEPA